MAEEVKDIIGGLEQRIRLYRTKLGELQRKHKRLTNEIQTTKQYLELAETLYRVEVEKGKLASRTDIVAEEGRTGAEQDKREDIETGDPSQHILLERTKYARLSVPEAAFLLLQDNNGKAMHAKEIYQRLETGGISIRGKTPVTSVATSLGRDRRFKRVAPNTFVLVQGAGQVAPSEINPPYMKGGETIGDEKKGPG